MTELPIDVVGVGNAIVDIIAHADDGFLAAQGMAKGSMALIDESRAESLYGAIGPAIEMSGGSAGNTVAGIASLGGRAGFIGKVRDDVLGNVFRHDLTSAGVIFPTRAAADGAATARCIILVSPDAQRTMNTYLGACVGLTPDDIDADLVRRAQVTYLEGYLYDPPQAKEAFHRVAEIAHRAGRKVALSLSDSFCVDRHREAFLDLLKHHVDLLFANEAEVTSLFQCSLKHALDKLPHYCDIAAVTLGAAGSVVLGKEGGITVDPAPAARVVDTTGAGDLYAAGFLYGYTRNRSLADCGKLGSLCAAEIISHYGARPETSLAGYVGSVL